MNEVEQRELDLIQALIEDISRVIGNRLREGKVGINYHAYFAEDISEERQQVIASKVRSHFIEKRLTVSEFLPASPGRHTRTDIPDGARFLEVFMTWE